MRDRLWWSTFIGCALAIQSSVYSIGNSAGGVHQKSPGFGAGAVKRMTAINHEVGTLHKKMMSIALSCHFPKLPNTFVTGSTRSAVVVAMWSIDARLFERIFQFRRISEPSNGGLFCSDSCTMFFFHNQSPHRNLVKLRGPHFNRCIIVSVCLIVQLNVAEFSKKSPPFVNMYTSA